MVKYNKVEEKSWDAQIHNSPPLKPNNRLLLSPRPYALPLKLRMIQSPSPSKKCRKWGSPKVTAKARARASRKKGRHWEVIRKRRKTQWRWGKLATCGTTLSTRNLLTIFFSKAEPKSRQSFHRSPNLPVASSSPWLNILLLPRGKYCPTKASSNNVTDGMLPYPRPITAEGST